jgi:hypothetical protein
MSTAPVEAAWYVVGCKYLDHTASNGRRLINAELEKIWKETAMA